MQRLSPPVQVSPAPTQQALEDRPSGVTWRAALLGLALVAIFAFLIPYLSDVKDGPDLGSRPINQASLLALLLALGPINGLLLWRARRLALTRQEVLTIYALVALTAGISTVGYASFVTVMATAGQYYASPENRWAVLVQPYVAPWMTVDSAEAVRWLWEGLPDNTPIPWAAWRAPLVSWGVIGLCLFTGLFSLMALMRRDWIESQRLVFPLAQIPLEAVGTRGIPGATLLRQRLLWVGFAVSFLYGMLGLLNRYVPAVPYTSMEWPIGRAFSVNVVPWGVLNAIEFNLNWASIGVMCLLPVEVSLSLWLFHVLYYATAVVLSAMGYIGRGAFGYNAGAFGYQTGGALVGFGAFVLWQSRRTIAAAARGWWSPRVREHDALELLAPRYALLGLVASTVGVCLVARAAGVQLPRLLVLLFMFYTTAISLTRVVAAAGTNHVECGPPVRTLLDDGFGTMGVRPRTFAFLNLLNGAFMTDYSASYMQQVANETKIMHAVRLRGGSVVLAFAAATILMVALGPVGRVWAGYHHGIAGLNQWIYNGIPRWEFGSVAEQLQSPMPVNVRSIIATGSGVVIACLLAVLQAQVSWWRLSPVGFLLQGGWGINALLWSNALVGWVIVNVIFRAGGLRLYQRLRPTFIGLFLGGAVASLVSSAVLMLSGTPGR